MTILAPSPLATSIAAVLAELTDCVCNELATTGAGPTCWCGMQPGEITSWEFCGACDDGNCGMGWVRLLEVFPYDTFPEPANLIGCTLPMAWTVEVGALRCLPVAAGDLPTPAETAEVVLNQAADAAALYRALRCCPVPLISPGVYTPLGPQGGCVGGAWTAAVSVD